MSQYLRPETLFGTKFESYLNTPTTKNKTINAHNHEGRSYENLSKFYDNLGGI